MAAHAILSASAAHRWINCPPSARLNEGMADTSSVFAAEGTLAHELGELELRYQTKEITRRTYKTRLNKIEANELYNHEMPDHVETYTGYVFERLAAARVGTPDALLFLEQRLDFSKYVPEGFGTGDSVIIGDGTVEIIDLKYGKGVEVSADENEQMMLYGLGAYEEYASFYDIKKVAMTIVQPRLHSISTYEIMVEDLLKWANDTLVPKARIAWEGGGLCLPGDWCKFCKVKSTCRARAEDVTEAVAEFMEDDVLQSPALLSVEEVAALLKKTGQIQSWAKDLEDYALEQARDNGIQFAGFKLVEGRSNRVFTDEEEIVATLKVENYQEEQIYNKKLKGITELEKMVGKKLFGTLFDTLIAKPPGKPALVPESDKRPAMDTIATDFDL